LYPKAPFDTLRDFAGVTQATSLPNVLIIAPSAGVRSMKDLIALVKQKPGMNYGHAGVGSGTHITGELFRQMASIQIAHIPYKGVPEVITDAMTARLNYAFAPIGNTLPFVKEKRLAALAVSTAARSAALPDVPTIAEAGLAGYVFDHWYGLFAPAKTPRAVVNQLSQEVARILNIPEVKDKITIRGAAVKASKPEDFDQFVRSEVAKITKVMQAGGVKVQ
jgi:tripartite-type tricarboxylate transporter receptor subunit TctC